MTNAPPTRKTHVIRLVGTNRNGDVLQDIWVDLERIDIAKHVTQLTENDWQGYQRKFRWMDDPDGEDYDPDGNPARKVVIVKICSPDEDDVDDPDEWVEVPAIKSLKALGGGGTVDSIGTVDRFRTGIDEDNSTARVFEVRKINHYDTNIDDAAQAAFDADPSRTAFVVPGDQYQRDDSTKDDSQFVDHEIVTYLKHRTNETNNDPVIGGLDRGRQTKLLNQYLIDESDEADGAVVGSSGINPPYRLDPYQNIVNVNLGSLAVEFSKPIGGQNVGHLQMLGGVPPFSKGIFSLWFRIPKETVDAFPITFAQTGPLKGDDIIPLVVFGKVQKQINYSSVEVDTTVAAGEPHPTLPILQSGAGDPTPGFYIPSYIGVAVDPITRALSLVVQIQMADYATLTGNAYFAPTIEDWSVFDVDAPADAGIDGDGIFTNFTHTYVVPSIVDVSNDNPSQPEFFSIGRMPSNIIKPDQWQQLILSFDVGRACNTHGAPYLGSLSSVAAGTTSHAKMWIALNDVNYDGDNLGPFNVSGPARDGGDANGILTSNAWKTTIGGAVLVFDHISDVPTCAYDPAPIPSGTDPLGIPATNLFAADVAKIEMAEFQFWSGQTLDTSVVANRRLFVDEDGKPVKPKDAADVLGEPELILHRSGRWKRGNNTGSLDRDFDATEKIKAWKPDPSLHGPQIPR